MRKSFAALAVVLLCGTAVFAQNRKGKASLGFKAGINLSTFRTAVTYPDFNAQIKLGGVGGAFVEIPLSRKFSLQPEFLYSQMGARAFDNIGHERFLYNYFSIPVQVKYRMFSKWNLVAGPELDFLIRAKQIDYLKHRTNVTNTIKDFDFALTIGIETWLSKNIVVGARYIHGTQDVSVTPGDNTLFNQGVQATIGWKLTKSGTKKPKKKK